MVPDGVFEETVDLLDSISFSRCHCADIDDTASTRAHFLGPGHVTPAAHVFDRNKKQPMLELWRQSDVLWTVDFNSDIDIIRGSPNRPKEVPSMYGSDEGFLLPPVIVQD